MKINQSSVFDMLEKGQDPQYIVSCFKYFTDLEATLLQILFYRKSAANLKQMYDTLLLLIASNVELQKTSLPFKAVRTVLESKFPSCSLNTIQTTCLKSRRGEGQFDYKLAPMTALLDLDCDANNSIDDDDLFQLAERIAFSLITIIERNPVPQKQLEHNRKLYVQCDIPIPSYDRLRSTLAELVSSGVLMKRKPESRRTKELYFLNPQINQALMKSKMFFYNTT